MRQSRTLSVRARVESLESRSLLSGLAGTNIALDHDRLIFNDIAGGAASDAQAVALRNAGSTPLNLSEIVLTGPSAARFQLTAPALPATLAPGESVPLSVRFNPTAIGPQGAALEIRSDDPTRPVVDVALRGLGTKGLFGDNEPSLQWILDTYQIPVRVGDTDPSTGPLDFPPAAPNDEITAQLLARAGPGPVTVEPIGVFSNAADPALRFGFYRPTTGAAISQTELFTVASADIQTLNPRVAGATSFDPGTQPFGLYSVWPYFNGRTTYSEDVRNTWETNAARRREMRWYPLKNPDGSVVPDAYVMGNEEAANHDMQDGVFIVRNVRPATVTPPPPPTGSTTYQAESAVIVGASRASNQPGYTGAGFVDFAHNTGDSVEWTVSVPSARSYALDVRYANGETADRPLELKVNGAVAQAKMPFAPTGSWATWKNATASFTLKAGTNTIRLTATGSNGGNLDALTVRPAGTTTPPPPPSNVYEAEAAVRSGVVVSTSSPGYTGSGFADYVNAAGDYVEWTVSATAAGPRALEFRYANGSAADRPLELKVNGAVIQPKLSLDPTGSWSAWRTVRITVSLLAGATKVRLTATGSSGPNLDSLTLL